MCACVGSACLGEKLPIKPITKKGRDPTWKPGTGRLTKQERDDCGGGGGGEKWLWKTWSKASSRCGQENTGSQETALNKAVLFRHNIRTLTWTALAFHRLLIKTYRVVDQIHNYICCVSNVGLYCILFFSFTLLRKISLYILCILHTQNSVTLTIFGKKENPLFSFGVVLKRSGPKLMMLRCDVMTF